MKHYLRFVRSASFEFQATFRDWPDGADALQLIQTERELRVILAEGERFPVRRGRSADVEMTIDGDIYRVSGIVKFRRLNVGVIRGRMEKIA